MRHVTFRFLRKEFIYDSRTTVQHNSVLYTISIRLLNETREQINYCMDIVANNDYIFIKQDWKCCVFAKMD